MNSQALYALALLAFSSLAVGAEIKVQKTEHAPKELQEIFQEQEDVESRVQGRDSSLRPEMQPGVERALETRLLNPSSRVLAIADFDRFPSRDDWQSWNEVGFSGLKYLGHRRWIVELSAEATPLAELTGVRSLYEYRASDKIAPAFGGTQTEAFFDAERFLLVATIELAPTAPAKVAERIRTEFHRDGLDFEDTEHMDHLVTVVTEPFNLDEIAALPDVLTVKPGFWNPAELMNGVRPLVRGDVVLDREGEQLTGRGVRAATTEALYSIEHGLDSLHDAFWNHDLNGARTTPRVAAFVLDNVDCAHSNDPGHGMLTAGVILGNGWFSDRYEDAFDGYRGFAPNAKFTCYRPGTHPHLTSVSKIGTLSNLAAAGVSASDFRNTPQVGALGNNGHFQTHSICGGFDGNTTGYYSTCNDHKNPMLVANGQVTGEIYADSSSGPTSDGRLKPDITAPTGNRDETMAKGGHSLEIFDVAVVRDGEDQLRWHFLTPPVGGTLAQGWGETQGLLGRAAVEVTPQHGRINVEVAQGGFPPHPWDDLPTWDNTPVVGTEVNRQGTPLADPLNLDPDLPFVGAAEDILRVTYRASGLETFMLEPVWFRDHPTFAPNCQPNLCPWESQARAGGLGIGDGTIRTVEIPIGLSGDPLASANPYWDESETWAGQRIEFLGFRLKSTKMQPVPNYSQYYNSSSGGTSGAAPVVGGAYALAMENLTRLYPLTDLDQRYIPSAYFETADTDSIWGMPLNSTWKALFIHTANDMIREDPGPEVPLDPDTHEPAVYHKGPDYKTGYGMVDIQSAIDLMASEASGESLYRISEALIDIKEWHSFSFDVSQELAYGDMGLKVTLAWDDYPWASALTNNLSLVLRAPDGTIYWPWSLKAPEPPVTADKIHPAQRNQPNDVDNVEQVQVDDIKPIHAGTWTAYVSFTSSGQTTHDFDQKYSVIMSPWHEADQCHQCDDIP